MYKKTVTYTDYDGNERTEDFYFNLNKSEIVELQLSEEGGLTAAINKIVNAKDSQAIMKVFKKIVLLAYGVKSPDGRRFIKNQEVKDEFVQTPAYDEIFMELAFDVDKATEFLNGIVPKGE